MHPVYRITRRAILVVGAMIIQLAVITAPLKAQAHATAAPRATTVRPTTARATAAPTPAPVAHEPEHATDDGHGAHADVAEVAHAAPHWSYEGPNGPEHWADLSPEFGVCATGRAQSPIDIRTSVLGGTQAIKFDYHASPLRIINNGHTVQVNYAGGSFLEIGRERYELLQIHFHTPSENRVAGKAYDMEAHLVHRNTYGELAVVGVFLTRGAESPFLRGVWTHLPTEAGDEQAFPNVVIDATQILPANREYFAFTGSLTTPPCTEGVRWNVIHEPVQISDAQFRAFASLFPNDARPVQPLNGRKVVDVH